MVNFLIEINPTERAISWPTTFKASGKSNHEVAILIMMNRTLTIHADTLSATYLNTRHSVRPPSMAIDKNRVIKTKEEFCYTQRERELHRIFSSWDH